MADLPEALRLADSLDECEYVDVYRCKQAAAVLRRLAAIEAERNALLGALKLARSIIGHPDDAHSQMIDAAIAKAEGGGNG